ncbi:hypothetical protein DXG01_004612 [Tephrocybe rancida]|nr:hypothetical protein DXG01_004612 [Tephrocybe rancida]
MIDTSSSTNAKIAFSILPPDGSPAYQNASYNTAHPLVGCNVPLDVKDVAIENLRDQEPPTLDLAGFQLVHHPARHTSFTNDEAIEREYYPESIDLIKRLTGASSVVLYDHTIRRRRPGDSETGPGKRQPVIHAHVDQTTASSIARVHRQCSPEDVPSLLKRRFQILNLWRPISHPAIDWPLALCDYRTVDTEEDTFPVAIVIPDRVPGESIRVKYNPKQKWGYFHGMTTEEVILFKCFDSIEDGSVARFAPHSAFEDPTTPEATPPRQSIELRALVFYD